jgi:hypothetical protein
MRKYLWEVVDVSRSDEAHHSVIGLDERWNLLYVD